ncbi:MAG: hypothetical protein PHS79_01555 [Patescibacteria group bacterium]|nr:hypothetical protein [Patescibacteria group bacterium]
MNFLKNRISIGAGLKVLMGFFVALAFMLSQQSLVNAAATCTFASVGDSDWDTVGNWSGCVGPPTNGTDVVIPAGTTTQLSADGAGLSITIGAGSTLDLNGKTLEVKGNWTNSGVLTGNGTTTFTNTGDRIINAEPNFYNVIIQHNSGTSTLGGNVTTTGFFKIFSEIDQTLALAGFTLRVGGNWLDQGGSGIWQNDTGTVEFNGTAAQSISAEEFFNNLKINKTAGTATLTGNVTSTGTLTIQDGTLAAGAYTINVGSHWVNSGGTFEGGTGVVKFYNGAGDQEISAETGFYDVHMTKATNNLTLTGNVTIGHDLITYGGGTFNSAALALSVTGASTIGLGTTVTSTSGVLTFTGAVTSAGNIGSSTGNKLFGSTLTNTGVLSVGSGTATSTGALTGAGTITNNSGTLVASSTLAFTTYNGNTGTLRLWGLGSPSITGATFYNLDMKKSAGTATIITNPAIVSGALTTTGAGKLDLVAQTLTVTGASTIGSGTTVTSTSGDLTFAGVTNVGSLGTVSGNQIMTSMTNSGTWELGAESTSTGVVTNTGTLYLRSNTLHVGGNWTDSSGTLTPGTGTIEINGTGAQSISADDTMYDLTINKTAGTATLTGNVTTTDNLTITNGTLDIDSYTFSVGGDYSNDDTLDGGTGTVKFNGTGAQSIGTEANFYALTISKTAGTATMVGHVSTTNMTVTDGTLAVADKILYVSGTYDNADTVSLTTGKIKSAAEQIAFVNSSGVEQTSYTTPSNVYLQIEDQNQNLLAGTAETMTVTFSGNAISGSDSDTITLTETGIATGIFRSAAIPFITSPVIHANNDEWEVSNSGVGTESFTDSQDSSDTGTDTVTLVYSAATVGGTGGGGGGGGILPVTTEYQSSISDPNRSANLTNLSAMGLNTNSLVKLPDDGNLDTQEDSAVYFIGKDGKRHAFPNSRVYSTWYNDFDGVIVISSDKLASVPLGSNVRYRPGSKMLKFTTDPKVYAVDAHGVLDWVKTEDVAKSLYGDTWNTKIDDMSDAFFGNYNFGTEISSASDFSPAAVMSSILTVSDDYGW